MFENTNTIYNMKKNYLTPEVQVDYVVMENHFLASTRSASSTDMTLTDDDGDWTY